MPKHKERQTLEPTAPDNVTKNTGRSTKRGGQPKDRQNVLINTGIRNWRASGGETEGTERKITAVTFNRVRSMIARIEKKMIIRPLPKKKGVW